MKRKLKYFIVILFSGLLCFTACKDSFYEGNEQVNDKAYFPLEIGNFVIYKIDSTIYDNFDMSVESKTLYVRELVESIFVDAEGNEVYRIERAYSNSLSDEWGSAGYDIWSAGYNGNNAEKVEENQRYIKLNFPLSNGKEWKGNSYINTEPLEEAGTGILLDNPSAFLEGWTYEIVNLHEPYNLNGLIFDATVTVHQQEYIDQIRYVYAYEIYAKDVGLIYKELWEVETLCKHCDDEDSICKSECFALAWEDKAEDGTIFKMELIDYGKL